MTDGCDLEIVGGRVIDPARGVDEIGTVAISGGHVVPCVSETQGPPAQRTIDATGLIVVPGLIDLHTHVYWGVSHYGVDADTYCLDRGVTTAVDVDPPAPRRSPASAATSSTARAPGCSPSFMWRWKG